MGERSQDSIEPAGPDYPCQRKTTLFRSGGEPGGVKAQKRTASISFWVFARHSQFLGRSLTKPVCGPLQDRPIALLGENAPAIVRFDCPSTRNNAKVYPLITPTGRKRATRFEMPA